MFCATFFRRLIPLLLAAAIGAPFAGALAAAQPAIAADGFIVIDSLEALRGYANQDGVKIRLQPGAYTLDRATSRYFIEITANDSRWDLRGVRLRIDTQLFRQFGAGRDPRHPFYCVFSLTGDRIVFEGVATENFGDRPGLQGKNKIFSITGSDVVLRGVEITTSGSSPWGYGSLYGIAGGDVRKMNGIRVGWPARKVHLLDCQVHMRAMGHAIFVQGATDTVIKNCRVDGLLRLTDEILAETSGYAFDRKFLTRGHDYSEGVTLGAEGRILPGEMIALSEDGIRLYPEDGAGHPTGPTSIEDCMVGRMRRGICTGLGPGADRVINCEVRECVAAGFNVGSGDLVQHGRADAKYAEAVCLPYMGSHGAQVDLEVRDSRGGLANTLLAVINGRQHRVQLRAAAAGAIPDGMTIELATRRGYAFYQNRALIAQGIKLTNSTSAVLRLNPGATENEIASRGEVRDQSGPPGNNSVRRL